jgi:signal transduction histidine kinase/CheY-like chemotaxis protein
MKQSKLSYKLVLYIAPLVLLPLAGLGWFAITNTNDAAERQTQLTISNFVEQQREKIENYLFAFGNTIDLLSHSPVLEELLNLPDTSTLYNQKKLDLIEVFATYLDAYPDIYSVELLTWEGEDLVFYSNDLFAESKSAAIASELAKIDSERKFLIHQKDSTSATLHYLQKIKIIDQHSDLDPWGFLLFNLHSTVLTDSITETLSANSINFVLADDGQILFCSDFSLIGSFIPPEKLQILFEGIANNQLSQVSLESMNHSKTLFLGTPLEGDFFYFSGINYEELSIANDRISFITVVILIVSIVVVPILILIVVTRLLLNPIKQLADASNEVGAGNLTVKLVCGRNDELGLLFNDFNQMINKILSYQLELKGYHQHLEDKVSERTRELRDANMRLKVAIDEAKQANQLKSRFLANMSHEIRTPLTAIIGFTEHCIDDNCSEANRNKYLGTVLRNSSHLIGLINNILDLSKIESEKLELDNQLFCIHDLVFDLESVIQPQAHEKQLDFNITFEYPVPSKINSDITRLKQVLINVCSNAIKFTKSGYAQLVISYQPRTNQLYFVVEDSGIGMTELEMTRIFKPFEQADSSTTRRFGGTGLGLCISQNLAKILGGNIVVTSQQGKGSCFTISINVGQANEALELIYAPAPMTQPTTPQVLPQNSLQFNARVLLAEDNPDNQQLIKILLEKRGIHVTVANNGEEAIESALIDDFDLILMDMQMPVMGGLEATDVLRKAACDIPIIALTANVMKEDIHTYLQSGCNSTVAKPIDQAALFYELSRYLSTVNETENTNEPLDSLAAQLHASSEFNQLVQTFLANLPNSLNLLKQALHQQDRSQVGDLAHSIKGSAGSFGYPKLTELAGTLEFNAKQADFNDIQHHLDIFECECQSVLLENQQQAKNTA